MAVLASLYKIMPLPELLSKLTQVQQLQAAVLADVWGLPEVSTEAVRLLLAIADTGAGLTYETVMYYSQMNAVPSCMVPLLPKVLAVCLDSSTEHTLGSYRSAAEQALLTVLGDLNVVWADAALQQLLLDLPLDMMQLLVSSSRLLVDSEATVMYTAQYYINKLEGAPKAAAIQVLGPLIRCQYLSSSWLASVAEAAGTAGVSSTFVLEQYAKPALQLLKLRLVSKSSVISRQPPQMPLAAWPDSWFSGQRQYTPRDSAQLTQQVDVSQLRQAALRCANGKTVERLYSRSSGPIQGLTWKLVIKIDGTNSAGTQIGVYANPAADAVGFCNNTQPAYSLSWRCTVDFGVKRVRDIAESAYGIQMWPYGWGYTDCFRLGYMSGGWNEAAWAAAGLPASGSLSFNLDLKVGTGM